MGGQGPPWAPAGVPGSEETFHPLQLGGWGKENVLGRGVY